MKKGRFIVHVDMDAFFASIEQRDNPALLGKPVVVGADPKKGKGRGVISTCSYEARKYGISSAMPVSIAYRMCPNAFFLPVDMKKYSRVSEEIYKIFYDFTPEIEAVGVDEAFLDITTTYKLFSTPYNACILLKSRIKNQTRLTASVGIAPTKIAAKIASDLKKPDGLVEVKPENLKDFLWPLDAGKIWGLGKKSRLLLNEQGIITIGDLARADMRKIIDLFGKNGLYFWKLANCIDTEEVQTGKEAKSLSNEITFDADTADKEKISGALISLCEKISYRLRLDNLKCRTITLKIRSEDFTTHTKSVTLSSSTNFFDVISAQIKKMHVDSKFGNRLVRLVGVRASNLCPANLKESLFTDKDEIKKEEIHKAVDRIREKFGSDSIFRAGSNGMNL